MAYRQSEALLPCPYEPTHQILPHRMVQHLIKCRRNHPEMDMKTCPFIATHVVPSEDYEAHILACPGKASVERDIYRSQDVEDAMRSRRASNTMPSNSQLEENWEQEPVGSPYNPIETMINKEITRPPPPGLMSKAEKKAYRKAENERVRCLMEGRPNGDTSPLAGAESLLDSKLAERDAHEYRSTASKSNLAMCGNQPLQRPEAILQNASRNTSDIFKNIYDNSQACEDTGAVQEMSANTGAIQKSSKAAQKNKKIRKASKNKWAKTMHDSSSNNEKIKDEGSVDVGAVQNMSENVGAVQNMSESVGAGQDVFEDEAVEDVFEDAKAVENEFEDAKAVENEFEDAGAGAIRKISKSSLKNKKRCESARRKRASTNNDSTNATIQANRGPVYPDHPHVADVDLIGSPGRVKELKRLKKKLNEIYKIRMQKKAGRTLEQNQIDKLAMEYALKVKFDQLLW